MSNEGHRARPAQLHVIHDLGGGSSKWLRDFAAADDVRANLVLRSFTHDDAAGGGVALFAGPADEEPLRVWKFEREIAAAAVSHPEYRAALEEIVAEHGVRAILVSSLIGHSLDALDTALPTLVVCHDYFPYCASINLYFGAACASCDGARVAECHDGNADFNPFVGFPPEDRLRVRERFLELVHRPNVKLVVPSRSVAENLQRMNGAFRDVAFEHVPHGYGDPPVRRPTAEPAASERLRIVVLGQLSVPKGIELLKAAVDEITAFADLYLIGCREMGELFKFRPHVHVRSDFEREELPAHLAAINPHLGLLASIVPETFSYTLSELRMLGVPAAATRVGSFVERIRPGVDGFLFDPDARSMVALLRELDADREALARVRANLAGWTERGAREMVADYHRLAPVPGERKAATPAPAAGPSPSATTEMTLASMWKELKRLHVHLMAVVEAREHSEARREAAQSEVEKLARLLEEARAHVSHQDGELEQLRGLLHQRNMELAEVYASTSWKFSRPVRWIGRRTRKLGLLRRSLRALADDPASLRTNLGDLGRAWRLGGFHGLKRALLALQPNEELRAAWAQYRETFQRDVRPRIVEAVRAMVERPLISVIVPAYDTPEPMLRAMVASVQAQLYPHWELCIADDGSRQPHVKRVLEELAARDPRIRLDFASENRGVAHASNRALAMAKGEFAVLLDHDDLLEEQALFRVAQAVTEDHAEIVYSDEALVAPHAKWPREMVYRPAFSPELLRGHPYIVHIVGFATSLLRDIGGFDESLRISQDYDLVLRATEKARTVAHIPEVLYQWRVHGGSAGHQKIRQVMETSRGILQRHLDRRGEKARVEDGAGFNFFDVRYELDPALKVAIVIPTHNHGALLRQCIESLEATIGVAHDLVVVDHESDERATLEYLAALPGRAKVIRYEGPFNFSAINNRAVAELGEGYTHVLFCNNDIEALRPGWLERMLELGQQPSVAIVGAKLFYPDRKTIQHAGVCVGAFGRAEHYGKFLALPEERLQPGYLGSLVINREVAAVTAACMLVRRDAFAAIGGFDAAMAVGFGDVDLCLRAAAQGWRVLFCPHAELIHHESMTRGISAEDNHPQDTALYKRRWKDLLAAGDPFYNRGLSLSSTRWAMQVPMPCTFEVRRRIVKRDPATGRCDVTFSAGTA